MNKEHNKLLKEWQNRLGLQDWHIILKTDCRPENMALTDVEGCTTWTECTKSAWIDILDEKFFPEHAAARPYDFERTLVHELLHCKLSLIDERDEGTQSRLVHQLIDDLARALVDAKRSEKYIAVVQTKGREQE